MKEPSSQRDAGDVENTTLDICTNIKKVEKERETRQHSALQ